MFNQKSFYVKGNLTTTFAITDQSLNVLPKIK